MSVPDTSHFEDPAAATAVRDVLLALAGLVVGAIVGLVIAGYAGWLPTINLC